MFSFSTSTYLVNIYTVCIRVSQASFDYGFWFLAPANFCYCTSCLKKYYSVQKWSKVTQNNYFTFIFSKVIPETHGSRCAVQNIAFYIPFCCILFFFLILLLFCFVSHFAAPLRIEVMLQEERIRRLRYQIEEMTRCSFNEARLTCTYKIL